MSRESFLYLMPVSYTHLDVYKRQLYDWSSQMLTWWPQISECTRVSASFWYLSICNILF